MKRPEFIKNCEDLRWDRALSFDRNQKKTFKVGSSLGEKLGLRRVVINYDVLRPGERSTWLHDSKKEEEEFIFVLEGNPHIWIDGVVYKLDPGDCVGLTSEKRHTHTIINNSSKEVRALIMIERDFSISHTNSSKKSEDTDDCHNQGWQWENYPKNEMGTQGGSPDFLL